MTTLLARCEFCDALRPRQMLTKDHCAACLQMAIRGQFDTERRNAYWTLVNVTREMSRAAIAELAEYLQKH